MGTAVARWQGWGLAAVAAAVGVWGSAAGLGRAWGLTLLGVYVGARAVRPEARDRALWGGAGAVLVLAGAFEVWVRSGLQRAWPDAPVVRWGAFATAALVAVWGHRDGVEDLDRSTPRTRP